MFDFQTIFIFSLAIYIEIVYNIIVLVCQKVIIMIKFSSVFKPTPLYKKLMILNLLTKNPDVPQRTIAKTLEISLAMVNSYLEEYEKEGLLQVTRDSTRLGEYQLTRLGHERRKILNMEFLEASLAVYNDAKEECINFIHKIINLGYNDLLFYGAGEVCELILYVLNNLDDVPKFNVLAVIDDDEGKIGKMITGIEIIRNTDIFKYHYDGILVSSYTNNNIIKNKLIELNIEKEKIIEFFEGDND